MPTASRMKNQGGKMATSSVIKTQTPNRRAKPVPRRFTLQINSALERSVSQSDADMMRATLGAG